MSESLYKNVPDTVEAPRCGMQREFHCWHRSASQSAVAGFHECQHCCWCATPRHLSWAMLQSRGHGPHCSETERGDVRVRYERER